MTLPEYLPERGKGTERRIFPLSQTRTQVTVHLTRPPLGTRYGTAVNDFLLAEVLQSLLGKSRSKRHGRKLMWFVVLLSPFI